MNPAKRKYALLIAADALDRDLWLVADLIADDGEDAELTAVQVVDVLRFLAQEPQSPWPSAREQSEIDRFGIFDEEAAK